MLSYPAALITLIQTNILTLGLKGKQTRSIATSITYKHPHILSMFFVSRLTATQYKPIESQTSTDVDASLTANSHGV